MKKSILIFILSTSAVFSQETVKHKLLRRTIGIAACAVSAIDLEQTARYVGKDGITEGNSLVSRNGKASLGTLSVLKLSVCAAPLVVGEIGYHKKNGALENFGLIGSSGALSVFTFTTIRNQRIINDKN